MEMSGQLHAPAASSPVKEASVTIWIGGCSSHQGGKKCIQNFSLKTWREGATW